MKDMKKPDKDDVLKLRAGGIEHFMVPGKGEYVILDPIKEIRGAEINKDNFIDFINEKVQEGYYFCGTFPVSAYGVYAVFWKPENHEDELTWFHSAHELPDDGSEVLVVMEDNDEAQKAHYKNEEWVDPSMALGVCFMEDRITKWRYDIK